MNSSFKPPPPIANDQRELMYQMFMQDPKQNGPRRLAKRFNLSLKRVDAILRLKGLEKAWVKVSVCILIYFKYPWLSSWIFV
jgi:hypothetical protein